MEAAIRQMHTKCAPTKVQAEGKLLDLISDARKALIAAEHMQNVEDRRRGRASGQRGAQRLRNASELHASLFGIGPRRGFQRPRLPRIEFCETLMKRRKALLASPSKSFAAFSSRSSGRSTKR